MRVFKYIFKQKLLITITIILLLVESICMFSTPYVSSIVIDYGIQQHGIMIGVPLDIDPYSYRYIVRVSEDSDKDIIEKSFHKVYRGEEIYPGDKEKFHYEINAFGLLSLRSLEQIFVPVMGHGTQDAEFVHKIDEIGVPDISSVSEAAINNEKQAIAKYKNEHEFADMYQSAIIGKMAENTFMGIDDH